MHKFAQTMNKEDNEHNLDETALIDKIIEIGEDQGFIKADDIIEMFPQIEGDIPLLEMIIETIASAGIELVEDDTSDDVEKEKISGKGKAATSTEDPNGFRSIEAISVDDTVGLFISQISNVALLTREEEVELSQRIEKGRSASESLAKGQVASEESNNLREIINDGLDAREHLVLANLRLVISMAKRYQGRGVPFMDLIQEGHIGLLRSIKKFEYQRGHKFSTYATWWIRQAITRAIADQARTIRLPVHIGDKLGRVFRARHRLIQELDREPTLEELAADLGEKPSKVEKLIQVSRYTISLETPVGDEGDSTLSDFIQDDTLPAPELVSAQKLMKEEVKIALESIPPREVAVLQMRYGIGGKREQTLNEIGQKMGITRERVRQIEKQAINRIRKKGLFSKFINYVNA